jgi:hypothetical protein
MGPAGAIGTTRGDRAALAVNAGMALCVWLNGLAVEAALVKAWFELSTSSNKKNARTNAAGLGRQGRNHIFIKGFHLG